MVTFKDDSFTVTVSSSEPMEDWLELYKELLLIMGTINDANCFIPFRTMSLLSDLLPELEIAQKMIPSKQQKP